MSMQEVIEYLAEHESFAFTRCQIAEALDANEGTIRNNLNDIRKNNEYKHFIDVKYIRRGKKNIVACYYATQRGIACIIK